jgi:hypothetical protein
MGILSHLLPKKTRFFKRIKIIPGLVSLNLTRSGHSVTVGIPHAHVTWSKVAGKNGKTRKMRRTTFGVPGTGLWRQNSKVKTIQPKGYKPPLPTNKIKIKKGP